MPVVWIWIYVDYHTEGLLLLTNDGDYSRYLELPANSIPRRYRVQVYGRVDLRWSIDCSGMKVVLQPYVTVT